MSRSGRRKLPPSPRQTMPQSRRTPYSKAPQHSPVFRPYRRRWNAAKRPIPYAAANSPIPSIRESIQCVASASSISPASRQSHPSRIPNPTGSAGNKYRPFPDSQMLFAAAGRLVSISGLPPSSGSYLFTQRICGEETIQNERKPFSRKYKPPFLQSCMKKLTAPQRHCQLLSYFRGQD